MLQLQHHLTYLRPTLKILGLKDTMYYCDEVSAWD